MRPVWNCLLNVLLCVMLLSAHTVQGSDTAPLSVLLRAVEDAQFNPLECSKMAETYGQIVARQRDTEALRDSLFASRRLGETIHVGCREGIRQMERATHEDEGELEALYRSQRWYEVNRALATLRYWQAWLDLALAGQGQEPALRSIDLSRAERGFQASSLRILYPGLVYGSWLGLAYVAQLQGNESLMRQRLTVLEKALAPDPENPLHKVIATELGLIALRVNGSAAIKHDPDEVLTASTVRLTEEQAFVLLSEQRSKHSGAIEGAKYLQKIINQGFLDDHLLARILTYLDEVVGHDIGPLGLLVDAEYAYKYQQYETNVLKFRQFLSSELIKLPLDLSYFQYHYAVSLYKIDLSRDSMEVISELSSTDSLVDELRLSLFKLRFIVAWEIYQSQPSAVHSRTLQSAAQEYISSSPSDPDVASAHLELAKLVDDETQREYHLKRASADPRFSNHMRMFEFNKALTNFNRALSHENQSTISLVAQSALALLEKLPRHQREMLDNQIVALQLRSVVPGDGTEVLKDLNVLFEDPALKPTQKRVIVWSQLRLIDRLSGVSGLREYIVDLPTPGLSSVISHELLLLLQNFERNGRSADVVEICKLWLPMLQSQPQLQRQVWLMQIKALRKARRDTEALQVIRAMLVSFPQSGDAWVQLAEQSEVMGDNFSAERALAHIALAEPEGSSRWLDVSLHRLQILVEDRVGRSRRCSLQQSIQVYGHRLQVSQLQSLQAIVDVNGCLEQKE